MAAPSRFAVVFVPGDADDRRGGDDVVEFEVLIGGDIPQQVVAARLDTAYAALVDTLNTELAEWITAWAPATTQEQAKVLAAIGVNGILGARFATRLFHQSQAQVADDQYLAEWTEVLGARIQTIGAD